MRRIHQKGPAPKISPHKAPASPREAVPFAEKLRQQQVNDSVPSQSSRRQPINDETHSLLSTGSRSKRKPMPVVANTKQAQHPTKSRMRAVLSAFGDCTVKRNEDEKRRTARGVAQGDDEDEEDDDEELEQKDRSINWKFILMTVIALGVFHLGRKKGRQIALLDQLFSNEKDGDAAASTNDDANVDNGGVSSLDKTILRSSYDNEQGMHDLRNSTSAEPLNHPNHIFHHAVFPPHITHLSNLTKPYDSSIETPYFWDVHFSGESVAEAVFSMCHKLTLAAEFGLRQSDYDEEKLEVFELDSNKYVNVDTTTAEGIQRASRLGLAPSHLADIIVSPYLNPISSDIFSRSFPGRLFAIFRHPVDRALGMYYYLARASWDPMYNPSLAKMSITDYAKSRYIENNWLTRFLVKRPRGKLTHSDLLLAKKILKFKCLVGLYDDMEASLARFHRYFNWNADNPDKTVEIAACRKAIVAQGDRVLDHPISVKNEWETKVEGVIKEGSASWNAIVSQNKFDMELYEFAKRLFRSQGEEIFNVV